MTTTKLADSVQLFTEIFSNPLLSKSSIQQRALSGLIGDSNQPCTLRSLHWKIYFSLLPVQASLELWSSPLEWHRQQWTTLAQQYLRAPDGHWVDQSMETKGGRPSATSSSSFDPLSNAADNPWNTWFADLETRMVIRQDVQRAFPDIDFFRKSDVANRMVNLLHVFTKVNPSVGYRQGMHEILGLVLWVVTLDSLPPENQQPSQNDREKLLLLSLSSEHIEHDTWSIFAAIMANAVKWYDPAASMMTDGGRAQPIIAECALVHSLLRKVDSALWYRFQELGIEPQIFGIKWIRLLLGREFAINDVLAIWDILFAEDPSLRLIPFFCLAMLLRIRDALLDSDYSHFLQQLLRYPSIPDGDQKISLLMQQAVYLRNNPVAEAGVFVRRQNESAKAQAGEMTGTRATEVRSSISRSFRSETSTPRPATILNEGGFMMKELMERADAMGINSAGLNKVVSSTLTELRKSMSQQLGEVGQKSEVDKLKSDNLAMGNAVKASIRTIEEQTLHIQSEETAKALRVLQHIGDVLTGTVKSLNASVIQLQQNQAIPQSAYDTNVTPSSSTFPMMRSRSAQTASNGPKRSAISPSSYQDIEFTPLAHTTSSGGRSPSHESYDPLGVLM